MSEGGVSKIEEGATGEGADGGGGGKAQVNSYPLNEVVSDEASSPETSLCLYIILTLTSILGLHSTKEFETLRQTAATTIWRLTRERIIH